MPGKRARPVRAGGRRKRTRLAGTSSAAYRNTAPERPKVTAVPPQFDAERAYVPAPEARTSPFL
jgi:hypothetical protein